MKITHDDIRRVGGIVHGDGNIFFTNIDKLHQLMLPGAAAIAELEGQVAELTESECDKIMAMSDDQISALLRQDGHDPADVARLGQQAVKLAVQEVKLKELEALSVTNIMLQVVPGEDGMGEEVYAKSVDQVVDLLGSMGERLENFELGIDVAKPVKDIANAAIDALETAMNGLKWYQDMHPEDASQADGEANADFESALAQLRKVAA